MADRVFYENEAFLRWQTLSADLPVAVYKDVVSERQELRVFLFVDSAYEIILFSLNEDLTPRDACFIMKTRVETDFSKIEDADIARIWEFYECDKFVIDGQNNDVITSTYNLGMAWGEGFEQK
jgi:hypothetical protein